jgi:7,8-dihydro-6-hydroxymethylpterin dimethyltransferase
MTELARTQSLCPHCLRLIPARRVVVDDAVYLEKSCPQHGDLAKVLIWKEYPWPYETWDMGKPGLSAPVTRPPESPISELKGCPFDCGICGNHRQATCTAILEVTHECDRGCPVCFAGSDPGTGAGPAMHQIQEMLQKLRDSCGACPLQLSGGEPAVRDDLPQIVALAREMGFDHVQVNTNGIRLAQDAEFGQRLKEAGTADFFLQFDGLTDAVYTKIRGAALLETKLRAVERCAELKVGAILVPTIVKGVNESQIGAIIRFAKQWIPTVKGVHFQPMTWLGRYPDSPANENRILIPDILMAIEKQTEGELRVENMTPPT